MRGETSAHETRADGWSATWQLHHGRLRITLVRRVSENEPLLSSPLATAPDLTVLRERHPELSRLWDEVRADFWRPTRTAAAFPAARIQQVALRSRRAGYRMVRQLHPPHLLTLLDADDGMPLHTARTLDQLEQWLNE